MKVQNIILQNQRGMSLMEILIAIALLGIMGTFVATKTFETLQTGKVDSAKIQIQKLGERLKDYRRTCGSYPLTEQGLDALITAPTGGKECKRYPPGGFIDGKVPQDPWDAEFVYESDGKTYTIISYGNDGIEGGEEFDADINSNEL